MPPSQRQTKRPRSLAGLLARAAAIGVLTAAILVACGTWDTWRVAVVVGLVCVALWAAVRVRRRR